MDVSEEKEMVYAILVSEDRIKRLEIDGVGYVLSAFPEQLVAVSPETIKARDNATLRNLTYEDVVKPQYRKAFKQVLENPKEGVMIDKYERDPKFFLEVLVQAAIEKVDQSYMGENYLRVWKVIEGPKKGMFKKPTKILAIGIYKK
jgi:hypothetical protein